MRGISEKFLMAMKPAEVDFYDEADNVINFLLEECQELNPWQPIESAPKDRHVLLHISVGPINCRNFVGNAYDSWPWKPTHWMELPEPPK